MSVPLPARSVSEQVDGRHCRVVLGRLHSTVATGDFGRGAELVGRIAAVADRLEHHPDVDLRFPTVHVASSTHEVGGLTARDVDLANELSAVFDDLGLSAAPGAPQELEIAIDAVDIPAVLPFWQAVLDYRVERPPAPDAVPALVDPAGIGPAVWFQQMDAPRPQRNRIHLDVSVPHDVAPARVEAALAAGGRLVSDLSAPAFWVLADAEGNEACVSTWQGREP